MVTGVALAVVFLSYTLVTGEGGMLWLCQITFAGVGALASAQFATVHGWPIIPAILMGGVIAGLIGVVIGLLTIRLGNLYIALVTLTFGLLMERLVFNLKDFANFGVGRGGRPARVRQHRQGLHLLRPRSLRDLRHPHREPAAIDDRARARTRSVGARTPRARWA